MLSYSTAVVVVILLDISHITMSGTVLVSTQSGGHGDEILRIQEKVRWTQHWGWSPPQLEVEALQTQNQVPSQELEGLDAQCCKFSSNDRLNKRLHLGYLLQLTLQHMQLSQSLTAVCQVQLLTLL